jgi:hypothetical protein
MEKTCEDRLSSFFGEIIMQETEIITELQNISASGIDVLVKSL